MNRLSENVFQFGVPFLGRFELDLGLTLGSCAVAALCLFGGFSHLPEDPKTFITGIVLVPVSILINIIYRRNWKKFGVVIDQDRSVVTIYKWAWSLKNPPKYEEIPMGEIRGLDQDVDVQTKTKLVNKYSKDAHWQTTETKTYHVVLQGRFGSRRITLLNKDDWSLFQTLLFDGGE